MIRFIKSQRVLTPSGITAACVAFEDGRILSIEPYATGLAANAEVIEVGNYCVLPGLVDSHVHVNDPGRAHWEGFDTATQAAAAGGCTCIVDMPLNAIPATTNVEALQRKREAARDHCVVDYAFWGGVVPGNANDLHGLAGHGVRGFKCFLADSGVEEFPRVTETDLRLAMPIIAQTGLPLLVHAEMPDPLLAAQQSLLQSRADWTQHGTHLQSRPPQAEVEAVELMIRLCREYSCRVHIVHVSAAEVLPLLRQAKLDGLPITAETCPHYLYFAGESVPPGAMQFKCAPPIRDSANRELLWQALSEGTLDLVATDHSPCPPDLKVGDFSTAWGGIASLSVALPVVWTAARQRGFGLENISRWMAANSAQLAGVGNQKGKLAAGYDADFVIFDPDDHFEVTVDRLHFRHPVSPYLGERLYGKVRQVFVRGQQVFDQGRFHSERLGREMYSK